MAAPAPPTGSSTLAPPPTWLPTLVLSRPLLNIAPRIVGNGSTLPVTHAAATTLPTSSSTLHLQNILVSPALVKNLISVRALTRDNNVSVEFDPFGFSIKDLHTRQEMLRCNSSGDLYPLPYTAHQALIASSVTTELWHQRLGHPGRDSFSKLLQNFDFTCNKSAEHTCHAYQLGKHVRLPFSSSTSTTYFPFQLVHSDVWTSPVPSNSGFLYYLVIIDDYTHYVWTFPLRAKSEVLPTLTAFHASPC